MAVSGTTSFTMNRDEVITDALIEIGGVGLGSTPSTDQISHAARRLNTVLKAWQGERIFLYSTTTGTIDTTGGQNYVTFPSGVRRIKHVWVRIDGSDTPLNKLSQSDYDAIIDKEGNSVPLDYMVDEAAGRIYVYPEPDAVYTLHYRGEAILDDMTSSTDNFDLPQPALDMIMKTLALELSIPYGLAPDRISTFKARADEAKTAYLAHYNQEYNADDIITPKGVLIT